MMKNSEEFNELTREQKDEFAQRKMQEMREKNEKFMRRHAEVENDRMVAESRNSSITSVSKIVKKDADMFDSSKNNEKFSREWDKGKTDNNDWHAHPGSSRNYRRAAASQDTKNYDKNEYCNYTRYDHSLENRKPRSSYKQHNEPKNYRFHKSTRSVIYRNNETNKNSQHFFSDEKFNRCEYRSKKNFSYKTHSRSPSKSDSDLVDNKMGSAPISTIKSASVWQNDKLSEHQFTHNRVEKWVNSVNRQTWRQKELLTDENVQNRSKSYSKFDRFEKASDSSESSLDTEPKESNNLSSSSKFEEQVQKFQNAEAHSHDGKQNSMRKNDRGRSLKNKLSPQCSSSEKNEYLRKRRFEKFDNKGFKNEDKNKYFASKNIFTKNEMPNLRSDYAWNRGKGKGLKTSNFDGWGSFEKTDADDACKETSQMSYDDDGWKTVDQPNMKWKHEITEPENKTAVSKDPESICENIHDHNKSFKLTTTEVDAYEIHNQNVGSIHAKKKKDNSNFVRRKHDVTDGWEDYESPYNVNQKTSDGWEENEISENMDKNCQIRDKIFGEINQNDLEACEWSSVEEGEIKSDDDDPERKWREEFLK